MTMKKFMKLLELEPGDDFIYFEQFAALMEAEEPIDIDTFSELLMMADTEALKEMVPSFFEDLIHGVPDDDTDLYAAIQTIKDTLVTLAGNGHGRTFGFFTDELYRFRQWYLTCDSVICRPESDSDSSRQNGGNSKNGNGERRVTPWEAFVLYREEKLSGPKYTYDFTRAMPEMPDEYIMDLLAESEPYDDDDDDELRDMLPDEYDPYTYDPSDETLDGPIDPYRDGFIDRDAPVLEGEDFDIHSCPGD